MEDLIIKAPIGGQLSFVKVTPGQQVASGESIAEIKVLDQYKIHTSLSEYYIDRITTGLPATVNYQGKRYPLRITKVVPEVKDRMFDVDLVFTGEMPENVRVGKSFRVQIELGQPEQAIVIPWKFLPVYWRTMDLQNKPIKNKSCKSSIEYRTPKPASI